MKDYKSTFMTFWEMFSDSDFYVLNDMKNTVENSPYHREDNVYHHTELVVNSYVNQLGDESWSYMDMLGAFSCVFHDFGKPYTEETHYRDDGSAYRSYKNHEVYSHGCWVDFWCSNEWGIKSLIPSVFDMYLIGTLIATHMPYKTSMKNNYNLKNHMSHYELYDVYIRILRADCEGKMADDNKKMHQQVENWISDFENITLTTNNGFNNLHGYVLCGPAGSGKSSYTEKFNENDIIVSSNDLACTKLYPNLSYTDAFNKLNYRYEESSKAIDDDILEVFNVSSSKKNVERTFKETMNIVNSKLALRAEDENKRIIFDNTHTSIKARSRTAASHRNMEIHMVVFYLSFVELIDRNENRNKSVPYHVIKDMYYYFMPPLYGEYDSIEVLNEE